MDPLQNVFLVRHGTVRFEGREDGRWSMWTCFSFEKGNRTTRTSSL